jgi:hypothetical protein
VEQRNLNFRHRFPVQNQLLSLLCIQQINQLVVQVHVRPFSHLKGQQHSLLFCRLLVRQLNQRVSQAASPQVAQHKFPPVSQLQPLPCNPPVNLVVFPHYNQCRNPVVFHLHSLVQNLLYNQVHNRQCNLLPSRPLSRRSSPAPSLLGCLVHSRHCGQAVSPLLSRVCYLLRSPQSSPLCGLPTSQRCSLPVGLPVSRVHCQPPNHHCNQACDPLLNQVLCLAVNRVGNQVYSHPVCRQLSRLRCRVRSLLANQVRNRHSVPAANRQNSPVHSPVVNPVSSPVLVLPTSLPHSLRRSQVFSRLLCPAPNRRCSQARGLAGTLPHSLQHCPVRSPRRNHQHSLPLGLQCSPAANLVVYPHYNQRRNLAVCHLHSQVRGPVLSRVRSPRCSRLSSHLGSLLSDLVLSPADYPVHSQHHSPAACRLCSPALNQ